MNRSEWQGLLERAEQAGGLDQARRERLLDAVDAPWWLSVLLGLAAWVASLFLIGSLIGPWVLLVDGPLGMGLAAVLMLGFGLWLFARSGVFREQMALAFALAGQGLLVHVLADNWGSGDSFRSAAMVCLPVSAALLWAPGSLLYRRICGLLALGSVAALLGAGPALAFYGLLLAAAATASWLLRSRWSSGAQALRLRALTDAATLLALLFAVYGQQGLLGSLGRTFSVMVTSPVAWLLIQVGAGLLLLSTLLWLLRHQPLKVRCVVLLVAGVMVLLSHQAPGLLISCALGLAVFQASSRVWSWLVPVFAILYLGELYYSLHLTLLHKSLLLVVSGLLLLGLRQIWLWHGRRLT